MGDEGLFVLNFIKVFLTRLIDSNKSPVTVSKVLSCQHPDSGLSHVINSCMLFPNSHLSWV